MRRRLSNEWGPPVRAKADIMSAVEPRKYLRRRLVPLMFCLLQRRPAGILQAAYGHRLIIPAIRAIPITDIPAIKRPLPPVTNQRNSPARPAAIPTIEAQTKHLGHGRSGGV